MRPENRLEFSSSNLIEICNLLNSTLRPHLPPPFAQYPVIGAIQTLKGHLAITTYLKAKASDILVHKTLLLHELTALGMKDSALQDSSPWFKLQIGHVCTQSFLPTSAGMQALRDEILNYNNWVKLSDVAPRYLKSMERVRAEQELKGKPKLHTSMMVVVKNAEMHQRILKHIG